MKHISSINKFTAGVPVEEAAQKQIYALSQLPFIKHVAIMPDVHAGKGSTVGTVFASEGAVIPAAVGVDIGCGMTAFRTNLHGDEIRGRLPETRQLIEISVPHGRSDNGGPKDIGAWRGANVSIAAQDAWQPLVAGYERLIAKYPSLNRNAYPLSQLGTLGTGNHFIEVSVDEEDSVWIVLHSGSRGAGARIGSLFTEMAKSLMATFFVDLPDPDLAYLPEGTTEFDDYIEAVRWAQKYAEANRAVMMEGALRGIYFGTLLGAERVSELSGVLADTLPATVIDCHHNFVEREHHLGRNFWVTRKGATRARIGDTAIIPGSMGAKSFIVAGKGYPPSLMSCSHGAGRSMSRTRAKAEFTLEDHAKATAGIECRKDVDVLDETPGAYKDIDAVMRAQSALVEIKHTLKQLICVKG
jgi:tRNA-splicing ligase RtcB (3'-phosphate/5'-hydroxy nucleic acid ligase)